MQKSSRSKWLEATASFDKRDYTSAQLKFEELLDTTNDRPKDDYHFNIACCFASTGDYKEALNIFSKIESSANDLLYNKALCYFNMHEYQKALELIDKLIEINSKKNPELFFAIENDLTCKSEEIEANYISSCIIEGINLKSAILCKLDSDLSQARECLNDIPIKSQELLDYVSLHNQAIYDYEIDGRSSIDKLRFLCELFINQIERNSDASFESKVIRNLINLFIFYDENDEAIKFMKTHKNQLESHLSTPFRRFYEICLAQNAPSSNELVYKRLDKLLDQLLEQNSSDEDITLLISIVTFQGSILWNSNQFQLLEKLLLKVKPFLGSTEIWKKNMAHTLFMLDNRFEECAQLYEELLLKHEIITSADPVLIGNLCISYVLTGRNSDAETLIKDVEADEDKSNGNDVLSLVPYKNNKIGNEITLLTLINLVIGTLYCVKYNYQFGLTRMFKALNPVEKKLTKENWFIVKRCILSMLNCHCKQMVYIKDDLFEQTILFLIECEKYGTSIDLSYPATQITSSGFSPNNQIHGQQFVTYEARYIRSMILTIVHDY